MRDPKFGRRRRMGLKAKIMGGVACGMLLFGALLLLVVTGEVSGVMRRQLDQRAVDLATNLGDSAAGRLLRGEVLELNTLVAKYALSPGVAYTLIRDGKGAVVAHSLGAALPAELGAVQLSSTSAETRRTLQLRDKVIYETSVPILQGRVGTVAVGVWADSVADEVRRALLPLIGLIVVAIAASLILSLLAARRMTRRILKLKEVADRVSRGDLESAIENPAANDEIGDLGCAIERMRASLKAAMARLSRA
jgi:HAMP domain-containing protein